MSNIFKKYLVWILLSLFYAYQYVLRTIPAISLHDITSKFGVNAGQFGMFCGIYYFGYTLASIPLSIAIDRYDARKVIVSTILFACIGMIPLLFTSWEFVLLGRFMTGIGSAGAILSLFKIISVYFQQSSKMLGMSVTIGLIGGIYGGKPLATLMSQIGFSSTLTVCIGIGLCMAIITLLLLPKNLNSKSTVTLKTILTDIKHIFQNKALILLAIAGGLMVGPMEGFVDGWSIVTFKIIHGWTQDSASLAPSTIFSGMCIGAFIFGYITDKTQRYYAIITISSITMFLCFLWILLGNGESIYSMLAALFTIGFFSAYQITLMSKAGRLSGSKLVATGTSIANMIVMIFGSIYHTLIGYVITHTNTLESGLYSSESIVFGILPVLCGLVIAVPMIFFVKKFAARNVK